MNAAQIIPLPSPRPKILFVDDEPLVVQSLSRALRTMRQRWDMEFCTSGDEALAKLEGAHFDVIVSDMRMPHMDGATLLASVRKRYPDVARIILSGYIEREMVMRTIHVAHQFLAKPCDVSVLRSAIERTCNLRDTFASPGLRAIVGEVGVLPTVPKVYTRLLDAVDDPRSSLERMGQVIEADTSLSAKLLQLVNSAFFGLGRPVTRIADAVNYVGVEPLKSLVLSIETTYLFASDKCPRFSVEKLQESALLCARLARELVPDVEMRAAAFTASVLRDVGRLVLANFDGPRYTRCLAAVDADHPLLDVEQAELGVTHAAIGAYLLGLWGLPYSVVEAVAHHHAPSSVEHGGFDATDAVYVAGLLLDEADGDQHAFDAVPPALLLRGGGPGAVDSWRRVADRVTGKAAS